MPLGERANFKNIFITPYKYRLSSLLYPVLQWIQFSALIFSRIQEPFFFGQTYLYITAGQNLCEG